MSRRAQIIATLASEPTDRLLAELATATDVLEVRADLIGDPDPDRLRSRYPGEILYTLRSYAEGGVFRGSDSERERRLIAASDYDLIDLEADRDLGRRVLATVAPERRVVSWHGKAESVEALGARASSIRSTAARWHKLVPEAADVVEALAPLSVLREMAADDLVMFASGEAGSWTRLVAPLLGAAVIYAATGDRAGGAGQILLRRLIEDYGLPEMPVVERLFGVVGASVSESLSPRLHNGLYRTLGIEGLYLAFQVEAFGSFWLEVVESGALEALGLPLAGLSVTTPHKEIALAVAGASSPIASRVGAANTLVKRQGVWEAEATDPEGVARPLEERGVPLSGRRAAVVGVGGAGRAAAVALELAGARVTLVNRTSGRGEHEAARLGMPFVRWGSFSPSEFDVVVNATPLGCRSGEGMPFDVDAVPEEGVVVDMVYRHDEPTALVSAARQRDLIVVDGREVLLCQAGRQFRMMTGLDFPLAEAKRLLDLASPA